MNSTETSGKRRSGPFTALQVKNMTDPGMHRDGAGIGLYLQIKNGGKSWIFRFTGLDGKTHDLGLGSVADVPLAVARDLARKKREQLVVARKGGIDETTRLDPLQAQRQQRVRAKVEAAKAPTFKECGERCIAANETEWKNEKHRAQWRSTLKTYAYPVFGDLPVGAIDTGHVLEAVEPIWTTKKETASRVRGRIESVLDWARARGYRQGENPARWKGHLDDVLPKRSKLRDVRHHPALPFEALPSFMATLRGKPFVSARALEFTILTAARTGETIGAKWDEMDFKAKVWTIPAERMKSHREHRVPLSERAIEVLEKLPREKGNPYVFPGGKKDKPLSNMAMLELLRGIDETAGLTVHGFRSTFRDWAGEQTNFPREIAEAALAHVLRDKTEAAYRRSDALEKRRRLMTAWAGYCGQTPGRAANVLPMHQASS